MSRHTLTREQVKLRLQHPDAAVDELYALGILMLAETQDRAKHLDSKAVPIAVYVVALITILTFSLANKQKQLVPEEWLFISAAIAFAIIAFVLALVAMYPRDYEWFSDEDWFEGSVFTQPDHLKRYYVLVMHTVNYNQRNLNDSKGGFVAWSHWCLGASGVSLLLVLLLIVVRAAEVI